MFTKRNKKRKVIPWQLACALAFVNGEEQTRYLVRKIFPHPNDSALLDLYDDEITSIIEEEALIN